MEYIFLAAGVGTRLYPYTSNSPKCLVRLDKEDTVISRALRLINKYDDDANITIVTGFCSDLIKRSIGNNYNIIFNPFYKITNSVASLWFARDILRGKNPVVILNGDIVFSEDFAKEITVSPTQSLIYYDASIRNKGDYNVQQLNNEMIVMGKELIEYDGEYVGITKFTPEDLPIILNEVEKLVNEGLYDQWYENGLVQLSLNGIKSFRVHDVSDFEWSEIDSIDNLIKIRQIIDRERKRTNLNQD